MCKKFVTLAVAATLAGCSTVSKEDFTQWAERHDAALNSAIGHLNSADGNLTESPPAIPAARKNIADAKTDLGVVKSVAGEIISAAEVVTNDRDKAKEDFFSPRQRALAVGIGATVALLGIVVVLLRYGGLGGSIAAIPLLGALLLKIGIVRKN